ncbi:hypothetical protein [Teredinibacter franksiae]|uniref:hypothetical protein n=1 Tax=Teredinibacter franksiae TaxID=2761453 RepID=UPI00162AD2AB|nr:hypothetical protein [Teredinibacter franksiae]
MQVLQALCLIVSSIGRLMYSEILSGLLGVLIGGLIGHRLSLGRDMRREYNDVVQPVRLSILKALDDIDKGHAWKAFTENDIDKIRNILDENKRLTLDSLVKKYWEAYKQAHNSDGCSGQIIIKENIDPVITVAKEIREFIKPK